MAITLKTATLVEEFDYILSSDPALDTKAEGFADAYLRFLETGVMPPIKEGHEPTIWKLRPIPNNSLAAKIRGDGRRHGPEFQALQLARFGLRSVENLNKPDSGDAFVIEHTRDAGMERMERITDETDEAIPLDVLVELGVAILNHNSPS